jgi:hypothetical protein
MAEHSPRFSRFHEQSLDCIGFSWIFTRLEQTSRNFHQAFLDFMNLHRAGMDLILELLADWND